MKGKVLKLCIIVIALVILIASVYSLFEDVNYFITKREAVANILSIKDNGVQQPFGVTVVYFNYYLNKDISCIVNLKKSIGNALIADNISETNIFYAKHFPKTVYLVKYKAPRIGVVFIDLMLIVFMVVAIWANIGIFKREIGKGSI
jgi:hypothetical protein